MALDISIKNLKTFVTKPILATTQLRKAVDVLSHRALIQEKIDGTKLTLIRTEDDHIDYVDNWIVSYKGQILHRREFVHITPIAWHEIRTESTGISQYVEVFKYLAKLGDKVMSIPHSTEFSIEFVQDKDTITRTYSDTGDLFLRSMAKVKYFVNNGQLISTPITDEVTDTECVRQMAELLGLRSFPVIFDGGLSTEDAFRSGIKNDELRKTFDSTDIDWNDPVDVIRKLENMFLSVGSVLGGVTEGVVLKLDDGRFFKFVQADQYDLTVRNAKKDQHRMSVEKESMYFTSVRCFAKTALDNIDLKRPDDVVLAEALKLLYKSTSRCLPIHSKKNAIQRWDDVHETLRLLLSKTRLLSGCDTLGIVPIGGKPFHLGHWKLIQLAANENDRVIIYTSLKDRARKNEAFVDGNKIAHIWDQYIIPSLPKNVIVKFVDSPVRESLFELRWLEQWLSQDLIPSPYVKLYSDTDDVLSNFPEELLLKNAPNLTNMGIVSRRGVSRDSTINISGTEMRNFLTNGEKDLFIKHLPPIGPTSKEDIWNILNDTHEHNS